MIKPFVDCTHKTRSRTRKRTKTHYGRCIYRFPSQAENHRHTLSACGAHVWLNCARLLKAIWLDNLRCFSVFLFLSLSFCTFRVIHVWQVWTLVYCGFEFNNQAANTKIEYDGRLSVPLLCAHASTTQVLFAPFADSNHHFSQVRNNTLSNICSSTRQPNTYRGLMHAFRVSQHSICNQRLDNYTTIHSEASHTSI